VHKRLENRERVNLSYKVEIGGAFENRQIPFVVGVMADLSGSGATALPGLRERGFVEVDKNNLEDVLRGAAPKLEFKVPNQISGDGSSIGIELKFESMDDFTPEEVAKRVEPIRKLVEARQKLHEIAVRVNSSEKLDRLLEEVITNTEALKKVSEEGADPEKKGGE